MKNKDQKFIGLMGPRGAGKDVVGCYMAKYHGYTKIAFADAIRQEASYAFNVSYLNFLNRKTKDAPARWLSVQHCRDHAFVAWFRDTQAPGDQMSMWRHRSPRWVLQQWGLFRIKTEGADYWIDRVRNRLKSIHTSVVFTDVRTHEEVVFIDKLSDSSRFAYLVPGYPSYENQERTDARTDAPIWTQVSVQCSMSNGLWSIANDGSEAKLYATLDILLVSML